MRPVVLALAACSLSIAAVPSRADEVDFTRDIRSILSNKCFTCHGPDASERQADLRLDTQAGATADLGGYAAVVPGKPDQSELLARVSTDDADLRMPPPGKGDKLSEREIDLLQRWIAQGADFARHWSYVKPVRPERPEVKDASWPKNEIDYFILRRLEQEGLKPSAEADRFALIRRLSLDLTGLPPSIEEVDEFVADTRPDAYERLVDRLLEKESYGEHWARKWLDLARYADSAGYADDPPRTIWGYRDWVIRALNENMPFDQFTVEQIAGDLLPDATPEQRIATAFHRNTLTNNEGGTNDEEFRNVAIVDRVNTTMEVWMGTTMACAQCHSHKYDPITQEEYFRLFAIFNNSADADRRDESPLVTIYSEEQKQQKADWQQQIAELETAVKTRTPELAAAQSKWEQQFSQELTWQPLRPKTAQAESKQELLIQQDGSVLVPEAAVKDVYTLQLPIEQAHKLTALRLELLTDESLPGQGPGHAGGNFVVSQVKASVEPPAEKRLSGRFVRIELPGKNQILSLAEVQVFSGAENVTQSGEASQISVDYEGPAKLAIDGNTNGDYFAAKSTTHTKQGDDPWWEVDLKQPRPLDRIQIWNRTDGNVGARLSKFRVVVLDELREPVWEQTVEAAPAPSAEFSLSGVRGLSFAAAYADHAQQGFSPDQLLAEKPDPNQGWAISPQAGQPHQLTLVLAKPLEVAAGSTLTVTIEQNSKHEKHVLGHFGLAVTDDPAAGTYAQTPQAILALLKKPQAERSEAESKQLADYYLTIAPALAEARTKLASLQKQLAEMKPYTSVPVMEQLPEGKHRVTKIQIRGNFLQTAETVTEGVPAAFHPLPEDAAADRLALAKWLVDEDNPLTARVIANRYWEKLFGVGIVMTSEEFGSQGELPSHPELLDWLATELVRSEWDMKAFVKLLVTSAAYRQSSKVNQELLARDPDNRLLARGPRFRMSAEMIRDQALAASGLLSSKMYGPPVKPPQPQIGLSAAFGGGIDWKTSEGEDRYRRGLYTTWRRSNPYPSMAAFDAPNREVCTIRRDRTNTPLQALVTLNDPVYVEAAQALARRMVEAGDTPEAHLEHGFRRCLARPPKPDELSRLVQLYELTYARFAADQAAAMKLATDPLGPLPEGSDAAELAAWTVVGNVLLNLDEMFMKR